jgi:hypothetical protein
VNRQAPAASSFRPFLPSKNFEVSKLFYTRLGFSIESEWDDGALLTLGNSSFILSDFYLKELAENFMMQLIVPDLDEWWRHIQASKLPETFGVFPPKAPKLEPWGLTVAYFYDPSLVIWHVTTGEPAVVT